MSSHPAENGPTLLDLLKAQARIENSRARENWDKLNPEEAWEIIGDAEIIREPSPAGPKLRNRTYFRVFGAIAQFERRLISERTKDWLATARRHGRNPGRPPLPQK